MFFNFHPDSGGHMIQIDEHIFQMGWLKAPSSEDLIYLEDHPVS